MQLELDRRTLTLVPRRSQFCLYYCRGNSEHHGEEWSRYGKGGLLLTRPLRVFTPLDADCCGAFRRLDRAFSCGFGPALVLALTGCLALCACEFFTGLVTLWGRKGRRGVLSLPRREDLSSTSASRVLLRGSSESAVKLPATRAAPDFWSRELVSSGATPAAWRLLSGPDREVSGALRPSSDGEGRDVLA